MATTGVPFGDYQYEIYLGGAGGQVPERPLSYQELEREARGKLTPETYAYVAGAAGSEDTARENLEAFRRWRIVPRLMRDVSARDLSTEVLGTPMPAPVMLAPVGVQAIVHPDAELATARAAASLGLPIVQSSVGSTSLEDVAEAAGEGPRWFQLYWPNDPDLAASLLRRAGEAGYSAVVVTVDVPILAWRPRDLQGAYLPFLRGEGIANYLSDPVFREGLDRPPEEDMEAAIGRWATVFGNPAITWERLDFLRAHTDLPILLKGLLHPDDARLAVDHGVDGLIVSNHGGRQVDGSISTLDALPAIVDAVPDDYPVLLDSGIRSGADAFKALALGARAVLLGRLYVWGLAVGGEDGVRDVLRAFLAELDLTLALSGHRSLETVGPETLVRVAGS